MKINIYSRGLVSMSICAPKDMSRAEIETEANDAEPTGIESRWQIAEEPTFSGGQSMPCECEQDQDRLHWLLHC